MTSYRHILAFAVILLSSSIFAQIRFDANFESGNINTVSTTDSVNWTVTTKQDIGGRWFYFRITGMKDKFIKVRVSNSDVKRAMYSYDNQTWQRFTLAESPGSSSFQKTFPYDTVYVSYYTPYTLTHLRSRVAEWASHPAVTLDTLGHTLRGLPMYVMVVTDPSVPDSLKQTVWVHARTHPSETPTSVHFEGMMKTLLSGNDVTKHYLKNLIFHMIPFTNPDGVYYGRSRTNFDGVDVESDWNRVDSLTSKEVRILKQYMQSVNQVNVLKVFLNLHSQASPYCTFWIHTAVSTSPYFFKREMQFSNLNISDNPYFVYSDYRFSNLSMTFPEGWQWRNWGDKTMALTYETPYDYYSSGAVVTDENLEYLGERSVYALAEYLELSHPKHLILDNASVSSFWGSDTAGTDYFGADYLYASPGTGSGPVTFATENLEAGSYDIYGWWPTGSAFASDARFTITAGSQTVQKAVNQKIGNGEWRFLTNISQSGSGPVSITVSDSGNGRIAADAFRIIYKGEPTSIRHTDLPLSFSLEQNYPNPFNSQTIIRYNLQESGQVRLNIYDAVGREVMQLVNDSQTTGTYEVPFEGRGLSSGVYYIRLSFAGKSVTKAMVLLK
ncbi:MAG: hypothetical protein FMNOHCHN_03238 [Ignavibacteriaceae bacterium]|nr:hypothetical protein [Ignavibacteriaceae bacterium]